MTRFLPAGIPDFGERVREEVPMALPTHSASTRIGWVGDPTIVKTTADASATALGDSPHFAPLDRTTEIEPR